MTQTSRDIWLRIEVLQIIGKKDRPNNGDGDEDNIIYYYKYYLLLAKEIYKLGFLVLRFLLAVRPLDRKERKIAERAGENNGILFIVLASQRRRIIYGPFIARLTFWLREFCVGQAR